MKYYTEQEVIQYLRDRIKYKYTQKQLAKDIGICPSYLSEILARQKGMSLTVIGKLKLKVMYLGELK